MPLRQFHRFLTKRVFYPVNLWQKGLSKSRLAEWNQRDGLSPDCIRVLQAKRLRVLLEYAGRQCPYYKRSFTAHKLNPAAADIFAEIQKLPPLTKAEVRNSLDDLFSSEFKERKGLIKKATGGSTGHPLVIWGDGEDYRQNGLVITRQRAWIGWQGGMETTTMFGGLRDLPSRLNRTAKRWLLNDTLVNSMAREQADYDRLAEGVLRVPPEVIIAYFSSLRELALALERRHQRLSGVKLAIACAEPLDARGRQHAEQWLGTRVYFQYGCRELGSIAQECTVQRGYHYAQDNLLCEVVDDNGQPADHGHLTITYFGNRVVPLIRYQIGDAAALDTTPCSCGLPWDRLKVVEGRISSMVQTPSGQRLSSMIFPHLFKDYSWITEYQTEQSAVNRLVLRVRRDQKIFSESSQAELENKLLGLLGRDMVLEWRYEEPFLSVPTGKHVYFISRV